MDKWRQNFQTPLRSLQTLSSSPWDRSELQINNSTIKPWPLICHSSISMETRRSRFNHGRLSFHGQRTMEGQNRLGSWKTSLTFHRSRVKVLARKVKLLWSRNHDLLREGLFTWKNIFLPIVEEEQIQDQRYMCPLKQWQIDQNWSCTQSLTTFPHSEEYTANGEIPKMDATSIINWR